MADLERIQYLMKVWPMPTRDQWEEALRIIKSILGELEALVRWIPTGERLPEMKPGLPSDLVLVTAQEFGQAPALAVARCWRSSEAGHAVTWFLDQDFYHLDRPMSIAESVTHWRSIPALPEALPLFQQLKRGGKNV